VERRGWFSRKALERVVQEQRRGVNHDYLLWALLVLEMWIRLAREEAFSSNENAVSLV
jgi:hypothetical protein